MLLAEKTLLMTLAFFLVQYAYSRQAGYRTEAVTVAGVVEESQTASP